MRVEIAVEKNLQRRHLQLEIGFGNAQQAAFGPAYIRDMMPFACRGLLAGRFPRLPLGESLPAKIQPRAIRL